MRILVLLLLVFYSGASASDLVYPYKATKGRVSEIKRGFEKIQLGDDKNIVVALMPEPDEIRDLHKGIKASSSERIGETYWYIIQRLVESGSAAEKKEELYRITFDLDGKVTDLITWRYRD